MAGAPSVDDVRPVVRTSRGVPTWLYVAGVGVFALLLFLVLDANRRAVTAPAVRVSDVNPALAPAAVAIPPLTIPPAPLPPPVFVEPAPVSLPPRPQPTPPPSAPLPRPAPQVVYVPQPVPPPAPVSASAPLSRRGGGGSALVYDAGIGAPAGAASNSPTTDDGAPGGTDGAPMRPARAAGIHDPTTTVLQGAVIPATLESALDSSRAGFARAIVARDIFGFDGSRVLVPRGSRLIGEYRSDVQRGQRRLLVNWTRLVRPDGVSIALASPAADRLGRAGVSGSVDTHFFERFAGAILQSVLSAGVAYAGRAGSGNTIAVLGGPTLVAGATAPVASGADIAPTIRVRQGASVSVFVARDLDFAGVEARR